MDSGERVFAGAFEERSIATVDGLKIHARDYAAREPGTGLPVVCLHGLTRNCRDFEVIAPRIASLGRRVIAADMRGRGGSSYDPDPAHYVPAVYAQDVIALMDALKLPSAVFIGTSMGAIIAMVIGALAPDRLAAAVLNDVGPKLEASGLARIAGFVGQENPLGSWADAAAAAKARNASAFPARADDNAYWAAYARRLYREREDGKIVADYDPNIALAFTDPETTPPVDMTPLFQALAAKPVLSVRGALSDILSPETVVQMRALKPDLAAVEVPNVGHAAMLDEPAAWEAIIDFLARAP
jgi:pimeloyl-ACP methyl ester carboxylesterase